MPVTALECPEIPGIQVVPRKFFALSIFAQGVSDFQEGV